MYQALYRKWRPRSFDDVCGQDAITLALRNELKNGRLSHAYLFTGCRGTGKTTCAKILAKAVNCEHPVDGNPCNECAVCRGIDDGSILDVTEIDAASNNGVDSIRDLRDEVAYTPIRGKYRVYIIDEVHMLSSGAFNALLKTLEEPPAHVVFILATTEVHKLPATILSRCQRFDFSRIPAETIADRIQYVAKQEGLTVTEEAAQLLARLADGAMRDALSLLDQCASSHTEINASVVAESTGMAGRETLTELTNCVLRQDTSAAFAQIDRLYQSSKDMERLCSEWVSYLRDLMILSNVTQPGELVLATPDEIASMKAMAERLGLPTILAMMETLQDALNRLRGGVSRRVEMEMTVLRLCQPSVGTDSASLVRRIAALENALRSGEAVATAPPTKTETPAVPPKKSEAPAEKAEPSPAVTQTAVASESTPTEEVPFTAWPAVMENLRNTCPPLFGVLVGAEVTLDGNGLIIYTDNSMFIQLFSANKQYLADAIKQATGTMYSLRRRHLSQSKQTNKADEPDPLSQLMEAGRSAGISVTEK